MSLADPQPLPDHHDKARLGSDLPAPPSSAGPLAPGLADTEAATRPFVLAVVTLLVGVGAGIGGMLLALLLHLIQHVAFGYSLHAVISPISFLEGVSGAPPLRRLEALAACGLIAGLGWWAVYAVGRPLVSIKQAVKSHDAAMPLATVGHALLQIVTVALGSPLGREVAPREIGALLATWLSRRAGLSGANTRVMIACGAGAGLASVYNVPLGGAVFTLEVLLQTFSLSAAVPAIATSVIAAVVAWIGLGDEAQYRLPRPNMEINACLVCFAVWSGPLFGLGGTWYARLAVAVRARAPRNWRLVPFCLVVFVVFGGASMLYPQLPGNGKGPMQLGLNSEIDLQLAATLLALKLAATTICLRAGAEGGMLTPGMTIGALLATMLGAVWSMAWPGTPLGAFAIVGATAFLSSSMTMPLTAVVLILEFTRVDHDFLVPILIAVGGAMATKQWRRGR